MHSEVSKDHVWHSDDARELGHPGRVHDAVDVGAVRLRLPLEPAGDAPELVHARDALPDRDHVRDGALAVRAPVGLVGNIVEKRDDRGPDAPA